MKEEHESSQQATQESAAGQTRTTAEKGGRYRVGQRPGSTWRVPCILNGLACQVFSSWPCHGWDFPQRPPEGWQRMKWFNSITDSIDMSMSKLQETVKDRGAWRAAVHGVTKSYTGLSDWTTSSSHRKSRINNYFLLFINFQMNSISNVTN